MYEIVSRDFEGFTIRRRYDGATAEFGPAGDRLTEWEDVKFRPYPGEGRKPRWQQRDLSKDLTGKVGS